MIVELNFSALLFAIAIASDSVPYHNFGVCLVHSCARGMYCIHIH